MMIFIGFILYHIVLRFKVPYRLSDLITIQVILSRFRGAKPLFILPCILRRSGDSRFGINMKGIGGHRPSRRIAFDMAHQKV